MALAPEKTDSVYDFLYVDARRIGVLLSQLGDGQDGVLTEQTRKTEASSHLSGGLSLHVAKVDHQEAENVGLTRKFDPQWLQPLLFLDLAKDSIVRDLKSASLGQIVLARGTASFHDYGLLMAVLAQPAMRRRLAKSEQIDWSTSIATLGLSEVEAKNMTPQKKQKAREEAADLMLNVINSMPRRSQMILSGSHGSTWSILRDDSMIVSFDEFAITHGSDMPGEWILVGLLDGRAEPVVDSSTGQIAEVVAEGLTNKSPVEPAQAFIKSTTSMSTAIKSAVGRPNGTFAITPLMVFREIPL